MLCEFCNEEKDITESTTTIGLLCEQCHELVVAESTKAIKSIRNRRGKTRIKSQDRVNKNSKQEMDDAFDLLVKGPPKFD